MKKEEQNNNAKPMLFDVYCPCCGLDTEQLHEGYCKPCLEQKETEQMNVGAVISRILFGFIMCVVGLNIGKWIGIGLFKLIMWLGILPYLEKFFGWFVF
jgi:hypothetical protein